MTETPEMEENPMLEAPSIVGKSGTASIWVDLDKLKALRAAVKLQGTKLSDELNQMFDRRTAEIKGIMPAGGPNSPNGSETEATRRQQYEANKRRLIDLHLEIIKLVKLLKDQADWAKFLEVYCSYVDYDKKFNSEEWTEDYCIKFIEEAADREADFKRETVKFLMRNKDNDNVYDWVSFVEKLAERRKLSRQMYMYQIDSLGPEEVAKIEAEERQREENRVKAEVEAKAEAERRKKEFEESFKKRQESQRRREEDKSEDEFPPDYEQSEQEEDGDNFLVEPRLGNLVVEDDDEEDDDEKEDEDFPKENNNEPPEDPTKHPIVSTGKSRVVA